MTTTKEIDYTRDRSDFNDADLEALDRALDMVLTGKDRDRAEQVQDIAGDDWFGAASLAAYDLQCKHLQLRSWEDPPLFVNADEIDAILSQPGHSQLAAAKLLKRMLAAGVSKFDPTPLDSIAAAKRKRK